MQFLQAILSKQQPQRTTPRRDIKISGYMGIYSDLLVPQTPNHNRSESCHLTNSHKLGHTHHYFNYSALEPSNRQKKSQLQQQQLIVTPHATNKHLNDFCSSADIIPTYNSPTKPFFFTIYTKDEKDKRAPSKNKRSATGQSEQKTSMLQIQVNKLPIIRKRQSKRKILAEAFKQRAHFSPEVKSQVRSFPRAYQPPPEPPRNRGQVQQVQICGWQEMDVFE